MIFTLAPPRKSADLACLEGVSPFVSAKSRHWGDGVSALFCSRTKRSLPLGRNQVRQRSVVVSVSSRRCCPEQTLLQGHEHLGVRCHAAAEVQHQAAGMRHKLGRPDHDLLQHRFQPSTLGRMPDRRNLARQSQLPQEAQAVVGKRRQMHDGVVGVELAGGQTFQI